MVTRHILILPSELYLPKHNKLSGIFQQHHAELLHKFGNRVGVISAGFLPLKQAILGSSDDQIENSGSIKIYRDFFRIPLPARVNIKLFKPLLLNAYFRLFKRYTKENGKPDILHVHNCLWAGLAAVKIKKEFGIPFIITEHSSLYERNLLSNKQLCDAKLVIENCDRLTVVSSFLGEALKRVLSLPHLTYKPIYNVLDIEFANEHVSPAQQSGNKFIFFSIGSLDENKNHQLLLKAFASKFKYNQKYRLHIAGDGPLKEHLINLADELSISDQFHLCGHLNRKELAKELTNCSVVVSTSKVETFGVALIEGLAFGKPIISTDSGGPRDIVNPINGFLVKNNDVKELSGALEKMSLNYSQFNSIEIQKYCSDKFDSRVFYQRLQEIYLQIDSI